jgi:alcohol dehydrogenase class IV
MDLNRIYQYNFPTVIRFGAGSSNELGPWLMKNGLDRPLIVTDPTVSQLDFFKKIVRNLKDKNISIEVFHDIHKNPVKSDVYKGTEVYDATKRNAVVGVGGGAALDVARAVTLRINHREDLFVYDDLKGGDVFITGEMPHFITIPTTAGTGSEVGRSAVISDDETHQKKILFSPKLMAKIVFADPLLTMELPPFITAATGMDALTHHMEAFLVNMFHPMCDGIALQGISLIHGSLEKAVNRPDLESRAHMLIASLMGAVAFQKGLGVVHSLAHPLSSLLDTHHGLANAVNIPFGMEFNIEGSEKKFKQMARVLELKNESGEEVVRYLFELNEKIHIPGNLTALGVRPEHIETLSALALADFAHPNNPKPVTKENFERLYQKAL